MLMNRSLEIRIRDGGARKQNTVLGALGLFERPALARCQQAKRVEEWDSAHARQIAGMWSRSYPFANGGHRLASKETNRTHETLNCLLRLYLCPKSVVLQQQAALKARLRSSRQNLGLETTWVALHARLAAGAYNGAEDKLLAGVQEAWDARPTTLSSDDSNTKQPTAETGLAPRAALFESFLSSTLRRICPSIARHSMSVIPKHGTRLRSNCPEMCSRSEQNASLGIVAAFAAVDRALNASSKTRFFFSTDSLPLQRFAEQTFGDRLVLSIGAPMHSSIANVTQFPGGEAPGDLVFSQGTIKAATDLLMYLDARKVVQLAGSTFSTVLPHRRAADVLTLLRCELLSGSHCEGGCEAMPRDG